jgi:hypothetical protein
MMSMQRQVRRAVLAVSLVLLFSACASPVGVKRWSLEEAYQESYSNALSADRPTSFTIQVLLRLNFYQRFKEDPERALADLHKGLAPTGDEERLFALAELSMLHALRTGSAPHFLAAAVYAYALLDRDENASKAVPLDPRNRIVADIYNVALAKGLIMSRNSDEEEVALRSGRYPLPFGELVIEAPERFTWAGYTLDRFFPAVQFAVYGLRNRYRQPGVGAPLIATLSQAEGKAEPGSELVFPASKVAATALLRLKEAQRGLADGHVHGTLELYTLDGQRTVRLSGFDIPLEFESTSAIAYALKDMPVFDFEIRGFFGLRPQLFRTKVSHLGTLEPYRRGKIPVVLVHGTASSLVRWAELINEMMADPWIAQRYQLWIFTYNTGDPILFSAGILQQSLQEAVQLFDPEGQDPALRQMVVIGHSQGGLLAKLTVIDSGTRFWDYVSKKSIDELDVKPETREVLRRSFFFTPLPFVRDVVFMATPHRGSYAAAGGIAHWLADIVTLPASIISTGLEVAGAVARDEPKLASTLLKIPSSVHSMDPARPLTKILSSMPMNPAVKIHSIIAVSGNKPLEEDGDGIVAYRSAHIAEAVSEKVIHAGHSVQSHPEAIEEIRRILLEHARTQ